MPIGSEHKVLVIGSGGREHALALRLLESASVGEVVVAPGNPGTRQAPERLVAAGKRMHNLAGDPFKVALEWVESEPVDLAVVGPEAPLCAGLADELTKRGVPTFGPSADAARLEGSKAFMKDFAARHGIRTARHQVVNSVGELDAALRQFPDVPVVKADGLCAGKGVVVTDDLAEARAAAMGMLSGERFGSAGNTVVLEERLLGFETSVHAVCDGENFVMLPCAQDHKRLGRGDTGPNTGGMGTFAPTPRVSDALIQQIRREVVEKAVAGMASDGHPFCGALFAGLMISPSGEPVLLEYNVRFGDPETQVLMGLVDGDFAQLLLAAATGKLSAQSLRVARGASVCVVLAAAGYPGTPRKGDRIRGVPEAEKLTGVRVYHAGTRLEGDELVTSGGRVLGVTGYGESLLEARRLAYTALELIQFEGKQSRDDIGAMFEV